MPRPPLPTVGADIGAWGTKNNALWTDAHASLDRVDPGVAGNSSSYLGWNVAVPVLLKFRSVDPTHPRWGAVGTGNNADAANNTAAFNAALLSGAGNAVSLEVPGGDFRVIPVVIPGFSGFHTAVQLPSKTRIAGSGVGRTIIKLAASQNTGTQYKLIGNTGLNGGDESIYVADLTVDGNNVNNVGNLSFGLHLLRARGVRVERVRALNVYGDAAFPPGETALIEFAQCVDVHVSDVEAIRTAGNTAVGVGSSQSTNMVYDRVIARNMTHSMGIASWQGAHHTYSDCHSYLNGVNGFNIEFGRDIIFNACHAGGSAAAQADGLAGVTASQSLGNTGAGIVINSTLRATLNVCHSRKNESGLSVVSEGVDHSSVNVIGGHYSDNLVFGMNFGPTGGPNARMSTVSRETIVTGNGTTNIAVPDLGYIFGLNNLLPTPTIPASGVVYQNPYPFDVVVLLTRNDGGITLVNEQYLGFWDATGKHTINLKAGSTIRFDYGTAPSWFWYRA